MKHAAHLHLHELILSASQEWVPVLDGWHFVRLSEGQAYWLDEHVVLDLNQEDSLVLSPARTGLLRASRLGAARLHYFRFCTEQLTGLLTMAERQFLERTALKPMLIPVKLAPGHAASKLFAQICRNDGTWDNLKLRALLLQMVAECFDWSGVSRPFRLGEFLSASKRIHVVINQLAETELGELDAGVLADRCGCSVPHFIRLFQKHYGVSFRVRQKELKLIKARKMLAETGCSLEEISAAVGAKNARHFSAQFKKEFGLTPNDYRRQESRRAVSTDRIAS